MMSITFLFIFVHKFAYWKLVILPPLWKLSLSYCVLYPQMRIGSNHLPSARLPHSKRLSWDQLVFHMFFAHNKRIGDTMFTLCQIICKLHFDIATWHLSNNPTNANPDINNEDIVFYRNKSLLSCVSQSFVVLLILQIFLWMCLLILKFGDVERNPGPGLSPNPS